DNPRNDWIRVSNCLDQVLTASSFARDAFRRAGITTPVHVVPVPVRPEYFDVPSWDPGQSVTIATRAFVFPQPPICETEPFPYAQRLSLKSALKEHATKVLRQQVRPYLPEFAARGAKWALRRAGIWTQPPPEPFAFRSHASVTFSGVVYTM